MLLVALGNWQPLCGHNSRHTARARWSDGRCPTVHRLQLQPRDCLPDPDPCCRHIRLSFTLVHLITHTLSPNC